MRKFVSFSIFFISLSYACLANAESTISSSRELVPEVLRAWVDARAGTGEPVHWVSEGGVYAYPSGEKLFGMIGFDSSIVIWPKNPEEEIVHLTRKTFTYTDPVTGEILTEYNGKPVEPIAYPYQLITYRMEDSLIYGDVEQGVEPRVQHIKSKEGMRIRMIGTDTMAITASVFIDVPLPEGGRYETWENYDFFIHKDGSVDEPHQMSWQRYGALPVWAGTGKAIYQLLSWRVESEEEFPPALLNWAKTEMPKWLKPPTDIAEVRALQQQGGKGGTDWAK
jgi:hypothetical protein